MTTPDVEVIFEFNGGRRNLSIDGFRPHHSNHSSCVWIELL